LLQSHGIDLSPEEAMGLGAIARFQQNTVTGIADALQRDRTTITRMLDSLENKGLIDRTLNTEDRRITEVHVTEAGYGVEIAIRKASATIFPDLLEHLSAEDLRGALKTLEALSEAEAACIRRLENSNTILEEI